MSNRTPVRARRRRIHPSSSSLSYSSSSSFPVHPNIDESSSEEHHALSLVDQPQLEQDQQFSTPIEDENNSCHENNPKFFNEYSSDSNNNINNNLYNNVNDINSSMFFSKPNSRTRTKIKAKRKESGLNVIHNINNINNINNNNNINTDNSNSSNTLNYEQLQDIVISNHLVSKIKSLPSKLKRLKSFWTHPTHSLSSIQLLHICEEIQQYHNLDFQQCIPEDQLQTVDRSISQLEAAEQRVERLVRDQCENESENQNDTNMDVSSEDIQEAISSRDRIRETTANLLEPIYNSLSSQIDKYNHHHLLVNNIGSLIREISAQSRNNGQTSDSPILQDPAELRQNIEGYLKYTEMARHRTEKAIEELNQALDNELQIWEEINCSKTLHELIGVGKKTVENYSLSAEQKEKMEHLASLSSHYQDKLVHLKNVHEHQEKKNGMTNDHASVASQLRNAKRNVLKLRYKKEELELDGASVVLIQQLENEIASARKEVEKWEQKQEEQEKALSDMKEIGFPEVMLGSSNNPFNLPYRIIDSKLLQVHRKFSDYHVIESLSSRVFKVIYHEKTRILKQYNVADDHQRKRFIKEIATLDRLHHPSVVKIEAFFREGHQLYIQMEYVDGLRLSEWVHRDPRPSPYQMQHMFGLIANAVKSIHDQGVIHCDLKPDNVIIRNMEPATPVLIDFDICKDIQHALTKTVAINPSRSIGASHNTSSAVDSDVPDIRGTEGYIAPELFYDPRAITPAVDVWSLGCMLFRTHFSSEPVLLPEHNRVSVPEHEDSDLRDLLTLILVRNPAERLSSAQVSSHPYFLRSVVQELEASGQLVGSEKKMKAFNSFLYTLKRTQDVSPWILSVDRSRLVHDVLTAFIWAEPYRLMKTLQISFEGELGEDVGGLTSNLYSEFFNSVINDEHGLFERSDENSNFYLPRSDVNDLTLYEGLGKVLAKCIYDQRIVPQVFPPSVWKFLLDNPVSFRDLEVYDKELALNLHRMMVHSGVESWGLDFQDIRDGASIPVTDTNKMEYKQLKVDYTLVESRRPQLEALKRGFFAIRPMNSQLLTLSFRELMLLCTGNDEVSFEEIKKRLRFSGFSRSSSTPRCVFQMLRQFSSWQRRKFIEFATGQCGLPTLDTGDRSQPRKITIRFTATEMDRIPISHVCGWVVDVPDYGDVETMQHKFQIAFDHMSGSGFRFV